VNENQQLKLENQRLRDELAQVVAIRRNRARTRAAEVIEGLAAFTEGAKQGDAQSMGNVKALMMVLQEAAQVLTGIQLPPGTVLQ
jgi:regulator of replication initiation timing